MRIYLVGGEAEAKDLFMLVDDIDADLTKATWNYANGYAYGHWPPHSQNRRRPVHRVILERILERQLEKGEFVDHINHNGIDNRRENLRLATHQQNKRNTVKQAGFNGRVPSSKYKGVNFDRANSGKWLARIKTGGKQINLGYFDIEEDAARAYDDAARKYFGEFAYCNFPE